MPRSSPRPSPGHRWLPSILVAAVTGLAFLPVMAGGFVNWDDDLNFLANPHYRGLSLSHLRWMFTTFHMGPYQPLSWLTLGLDYTVWGMAPRGYHVTSLLLHVANAVIFLGLARDLLRAAGSGTASPWPAVFAALFFSVHPLRVESVAWITERRDVVSGLFFLLMVLTYVRSRRRLAFLFFILSLLSKATGVTAPLVLLILDVYPLKRLPPSPRGWPDGEHRRVLVEKVPWFLAAILVGIIALIGQKSEGALKDVAFFGLWQRAALTAFASGFYLLKTILPLGLSPLYELRSDFDFAGSGVLAATAALIGGTTVFLITRRRCPAALAAWATYLVMILPVSGVARAGSQLAADRYTYFACMPWALVAGALAGSGLRRFRAASLAIGSVVVILLGGLTFAQARIWRDSVSLWSHAVRLDPEADRAWINLASAYVDLGRYREAEEIYRRRIAADPGHKDARYSLGMVCLMTDRVPEAEAAFRSLIADFEDFPMGYYGLGILHMKLGRTAESRASLEAALKRRPDLEMARAALRDLEGEHR